MTGRLSISHSRVTFACAPSEVRPSLVEIGKESSGGEWRRTASSSAVDPRSALGGATGRQEAGGRRQEAGTRAPKEGADKHECSWSLFPTSDGSRQRVSRSALNPFTFHALGAILSHPEAGAHSLTFRALSVADGNQGALYVKWPTRAMHAQGPLRTVRPCCSPTSPTPAGL